MRHQRLIARAFVQCAGLVYRPRRDEFVGELSMLQATSSESGIGYAAGTLLGASFERVVSVRHPLRIDNVSKSFGDTQAVRGVTLDIPAGSITALVGGNGAGKSTLIRLLAGLHERDSGTIHFGHSDVDARGGRDGIAFVHQENGMFDHMTVAQNLLLAQGSPMPRFINRRTENERARSALAHVGSNIDPNQPLNALNRADRQLVAIAGALASNCGLLVLDEPSSSLTKPGTDRLFRALDGVRRNGTSLLFVSHRIDEVVEIADRIAVLRDGVLVHEGPVSQTCPEEIVKHIVGELAPPQVASRA